MRTNVRIIKGAGIGVNGGIFFLNVMRPAEIVRV